MEGFSLKLATKNTYDGWIDFEDGSRLKIDYPTLEQKAKLNSLLLKLNSVGPEMKQSTTVDYMRLYIKYTVKDWEIKEAPKCLLNKGEMKDELWLMLCDSTEQTAVIFNKIIEQLDADEETKKKS